MTFADRNRHVSLFRPAFLVTLLQMISDWLIQMDTFPQAAGSRTKKPESLTQLYEGTPTNTRLKLHRITAIVCTMFKRHYRQRKEEEVVQGDEEPIYKALLLPYLLCFHSSISHLPLPEELKLKGFFHRPLSLSPYDCFHAKPFPLLGPSSAGPSCFIERQCK
jgi:hypothetical protein